MDGRATAPQELLLIRAGHHLWREMKSNRRAGWPHDALCLALQSVWDAKEAVRVPLRKEWLEHYEKRQKRISVTGFQKAT